MAKKGEMIKADVDKLDNVAEEYQLAKMDMSGKVFKRALTLSSGMARIRNALTEDIMTQVLSLKGSALGFKTDRDSPEAVQKYGPYDMATIRDCLIEATLRGAAPVGNEFNIISSRAYMTKEYFQRQVRQFPGLTDLVVDMSVPQLREGRTVVRFKASWKLKGKHQSLTRDISVRVNSGMGDDAILGKATRKGLKAVYEFLTGSEQSIPEGDVDDIGRPLKPAVEVGTIDTPAAVEVTPPPEQPAEEPEQPEPEQPKKEPAEATPTPKRGRGRPKGSKNKPKTDEESADQEFEALKKEANDTWGKLSTSQQERVMKSYKVTTPKDMMEKVALSDDMDEYKANLHSFVCVCGEIMQEDEAE